MLEREEEPRGSQALVSAYAAMRMLSPNVAPPATAITNKTAPNME